MIGNYAFKPEYENIVPHRRHQIDKCKFVNRSDHIQMELDNPQDGHRCDAYHNASNAKVNTRKLVYK